MCYTLGLRSPPPLPPPHALWQVPAVLQALQLMADLQAVSRRGGRAAPLWGLPAVEAALPS